MLLLRLCSTRKTYALLGIGILVCVLVAYFRIGDEVRTIRNDFTNFAKLEQRGAKALKLLKGNDPDKATTESDRLQSFIATNMPLAAMVTKKPTIGKIETTSTTIATSTSVRTEKTSTATAKTTTTTTAKTTTTTTNIPTTTSKQQYMNTVAQTMQRRGMSQAERIIALDLLKVIIKVAKRLGLVHFIFGGTMVGSWRNHGIIPWDDDIDLSFNASDKNRLREGIAALGSPYKCNDGSARIKMWSDSSTIQSPYSWKWPYIDVIFFENNETHLWEKAGEFRSTKYKMADVFPLHERPFEQLWVNAPHNIVAMYLLYFGQPDWCTTWWYVHKFEKGGKMIGFNCKELAPYFPFVHRDIVNGTMRETLKLLDVVVSSVMVPGEPVEHITAPYGFRALDVTSTKKSKR
ncbi:uncharacterized protein LOC135498429 isoform X2 [Lineus longissimus]|uniref:uncharacterized protein LOC135498429 isoform X2 n=1 Tax=Lineus longissimus TaxID=88925 RepID=UPI002B4DB7C0